MPPRARSSPQNSPAAAASRESFQKNAIMSQNELYQYAFTVRDPVETFLSALAKSAVLFFGISVVAHQFFEPAKPKISQNKCATILNTMFSVWAQTVQEASKREQAMLESNPHITADERLRIVEYMRYSIVNGLTQQEEQILQEAHCTKEQLKQACDEYHNVSTISKLVDDLTKISATILPPPPLPEGWTENDALELLSEVYELRLATMEDVYKALDIDKARLQDGSLPPQIAADLNSAYAESLNRRYQALWDERGIDSTFVVRITRSLQKSPAYTELHTTYQEERQQRYNALGLTIRRNA